MSKRTILKQRSIDIIEEANRYHFIANNDPKNSVYVGNRTQLEWYMQFISVDQVIATFGTRQKCMIIIDLSLGELMDFLSRHKRIVN